MARYSLVCKSGSVGETVHCWQTARDSGMRKGFSDGLDVQYLDSHAVGNNNAIGIH